MKNQKASNNFFVFCFNDNLNAIHVRIKQRFMAWQESTPTPHIAVGEWGNFWLFFNHRRKQWGD
jgi:hypothetical protein